MASSVALLELGSFCLLTMFHAALPFESPWARTRSARDSRVDSRHHLPPVPMMDYISRVCPAASHSCPYHDFAPCLQYFSTPSDGCVDLAPLECISYRALPVLITHTPQNHIRLLDTLPAIPNKFCFLENRFSIFQQVKIFWLVQNHYQTSHYAFLPTLP